MTGGRSPRGPQPAASPSRPELAVHAAVGFDAILRALGLSREDYPLAPDLDLPAWGSGPGVTPCQARGLREGVRRAIRIGRDRATAEHLHGEWDATILAGGESPFPVSLLEHVAFAKHGGDVFLSLAVHGIPMPVLGLDPGDASGLPDERLADLVAAALGRGTNVVAFVGDLEDARRSWWVGLAAPGGRLHDVGAAGGQPRGRLVFDRRVGMTPDPRAAEDDEARVSALSEAQLATLRDHLAEVREATMDFNPA